MNFINDILSYFEKLKVTIDNLDMESMNSAMNVIVSAYKNNANIYIFGNGGSSATASHFVCDFNKGISEGKEKKFRLICLNDNVPSIMAIANDIGYDEIFLYQLRNVLKPQDLIIAISGSGNSANVISAVEYAKQCGNEVVGLTGYDGGQLKLLADYCMHVDVDDMQITEDIHMVFDHMMMRIFCRRLS